MSRDPLSTTSVLNDAGELIPALAAPWAGILLLTTIPYRLAQVHFVHQLSRLGDEAGLYGRALFELALLTTTAFIVACFGRMWFARACRLYSGQTVPAVREVLKISPASLLNYLVVALMFEALFIGFLFTFVAIPIVAILAGLATATAGLVSRPSIIESFAITGRYARRPAVLIAISFVFGVAFLAALVNLAFLFSFGLWASGGLTGFDLTRWQLLLNPKNQLYLLLLTAGSLLVIEPFWIASFVIYVDKARAAESGDDLRRWWRQLSEHSGPDPASGAYAPSKKNTLSALLLFLIVAPFCSADELTLSDYRSRLQSIDGAITSNQLDAAKAAATDLQRHTVSSAHGTIKPDTPLLSRIATAKSEKEIRHVRPELQNLIAELGRDRGVTTEKAADVDLVQRLRRDEELETLEKGGAFRATPEVNSGLLNRVAFQLARFWTWLVSVFEKLFDWFMDLWPDPQKPEREGGGVLGMSTTVAITVGAIVLILGLLAFEVYRRRRHLRTITVAASNLPVVSARDEDPLSRGASEWERYAQELAAAGRIREAIRAWYHAVLVTLYRTGVLHYRKGRTNWEYISLLPADVPWRQRFIGLTRKFEQEWYGRDRSSGDALDACASDAQRILSSLRRGEPA